MFLCSIQQRRRCCRKKRTNYIHINVAGIQLYIVERPSHRDAPLSYYVEYHAILHKDPRSYDILVVWSMVDRIYDVATLVESQLTAQRTTRPYFTQRVVVKWLLTRAIWFTVKRETLTTCNSDLDAHVEEECGDKIPCTEWMSWKIGLQLCPMTNELLSKCYFEWLT